ncbi:MAG TPA: hypothetical protein VJ579_00390 [Candidatus Paceibacterota bacterium]|nr:hypothetical protein [Candidatus Paceibacterota bacterium]
MKKPIPARYLLVVRLFIGLLLGILAYLALILAAQYHYIAREQMVHGKRMQISNFRRQHALTVEDISLIEPWMTFDYIATVFRIPSSYIKTTLNIADPRFPRITLHRYAKINRLSEREFTLAVIDTVGKYFVETSTEAKE